MAGFLHSSHPFIFMKIAVRAHRRKGNLIRKHSRKIKKNMTWDIDRAKRDSKYGGRLEYVDVKAIDERPNEIDDDMYYDTEEQEEKSLSNLADIIESPYKKVEIPFAEKKGDKYEISEGRHRVMAAKSKGHKTIPLLVKDW